MPNYSLIFARTLQHATDSALLDWQWQGVDELRNQFRRPDNGEHVRWVPDVPPALNDLRWLTRVYLGRDWEKRTDATKVVDLIEVGFFKLVEPDLPEPRDRRRRAGESSYADKARALAEFNKATAIRRS